MPVVAEYADEVITLRLIGEYTLDEMKTAFFAAVAEHTRPGPGLVLDVTRSLSVRSRPAEQVREVSRWWGTRAGQFGHRMALVATPGTVEFGMTRLSAVAVEEGGITARVFGSEQEARIWILGTDPRPRTE